MKKLMRELAFFLILLLVAGVSSMVTVYLISTRKGLVEVPDISGKDIVSALNILRKKGLGAQTSYEKHPYIPKDYVIAQHPAPGEKIPANNQVKITLSAGKPKLVIPEIKGKPLAEVRILFSQVGLREGFLTYIYSDEPKDIVLDYHPEGGELMKGERVNLLISQGREPEPLFIPDLIDKDIDEAILMVKEMGCTLGSVTFGSGTRVTSQSPIPYTRAKKGDTINLVVGDILQ